AHHRRELGQRQGRAVQLHAVDPRRRQLGEAVRARECLPHGIDGVVLLALSDYIVAERRAIRLVPVLPLVPSHPRPPPDLGRDHLFFAHVAECPIELARQRCPLLTLQHCPAPPLTQRGIPNPRSTYTTTPRRGVIRSDTANARTHAT